MSRIRGPVRVVSRLLWKEALDVLGLAGHALRIDCFARDVVGIPAATKQSSIFVCKIASEGAREIPDRFELMADTLSRARYTGLLLEFGVAQGQSVNFLASRAAPRRIIGFDTFTGLPEDWGSEPRGTFSSGGRLPVVAENVTLVSGLFEKTLPEFLRENTDPVSFVHLDADLYSSTKFVMETLHLAGRFEHGTILLFDEFFGVPRFMSGEYRAWFESAVSRIPHRFLAYSLRSGQVAIQLDACI